MANATFTVVKAIVLAHTGLQWNRNLTECLSNSLRRRLSDRPSVRSMSHWSPALNALYNGDVAVKCAENTAKFGFFELEISGNTRYIINHQSDYREADLNFRELS